MTDWGSLVQVVCLVTSELILSLRGSGVRSVVPISSSTFATPQAARLVRLHIGSRHVLNQWATTVTQGSLLPFCPSSVKHTACDTVFTTVALDLVETAAYLIQNDDIERSGSLQQRGLLPRQNDEPTRQSTFTTSLWINSDVRRAERILVRATSPFSPKLKLVRS
jgi:hypothetical protein